MTAHPSPSVSVVMAVCALVVAGTSVVTVAAWWAVAAVRSPTARVVSCVAAVVAVAAFVVAEQSWAAPLLYPPGP